MFKVDDKIPYRLIFGSNKEIEFVDISTIYGRDLNLDKPLFQDLTPIIKMTKFEKYYFIEIEKEKSKWRYFYAPWPGQLKLIEPQLPDEDKNLEPFIF